MIVLMLVITEILQSELLMVLILDFCMPAAVIGLEC